MLLSLRNFFASAGCHGLSCQSLNCASIIAVRVARGREDALPVRLRRRRAPRQSRAVSPTRYGAERAVAPDAIARCALSAIRR